MKYKNISNQTQALIGFGVVEPDGIIETEEEINNPNFELVKQEPRKTGIKENDNIKRFRNSS